MFNVLEKKKKKDLLIIRRTIKKKEQVPILFQKKTFQDQLPSLLCESEKFFYIEKETNCTGTLCVERKMNQEIL